MYPLLNTAVMTVFVMTAMRVLPNRPSAASFLVLVVIGAIAYFSSVAITVRSRHYRAPKELMARLRDLPTEL